MNLNKNGVKVKNYQLIQYLIHVYKVFRSDILKLVYTFIFEFKTLYYGKNISVAQY